MWLIILLLPATINLFVGELAQVPTNSMYPTISSGDRIWYEKYSYGAVLPRRIAEIPLVNLLCAIPSVWKNDTARNWGYHRISGFGKPKRMDIIVFRNPVDKTQLLTKRIIGLPGDTVRIQRGRVYINGQPIEEKGGRTATVILSNICFPKEKEKVWSSVNYGPLWIPEYVDERKNCYFVMGDNRSNSLDSRYIGFVTFETIVGKVRYVIP